MIPNNLYEKYTLERERLYMLLDQLDGSITALTVGNVKSYSLGNRSVTHRDLTELKATRDDVMDRIDELEALLSGRSPRCVSVNTYIHPSWTMPRK